LTWAKFAKSGLKSIRYGVLWKYLTPYCHCKEPLFVRHYIVGAIMPGIVLGFVPCIAAILNGNLMLLEFGLLFTYGAGGDFMIYNLIRKEKKDTLVQDHPSKMGCIIYRKK
jgi:Putative zincin peptidase